jgi:hypothetical protein
LSNRNARGCAGAADHAALEESILRDLLQSAKSDL